MDKKSPIKNAMHEQLVSQWITSLAISVVCCSVLFIVFAGYVVQLHETNNLLTVRIEMINGRQNHLEAEMAALRRTPVVNLSMAPKEEAKPQPDKATSENGMELSVDMQKGSAKDELMKAVTGEVSLPTDAMNLEVEKMLKKDMPNPTKK